MEEDPDMELMNELMVNGLAAASVHPDNRPTMLMVPLERETKRKRRLERHAALATRVLQWLPPDKNSIHWENSEGPCHGRCRAFVGVDWNTRGPRYISLEITVVLGLHRLQR
jgi:hypothetical protein